MFNATFNNISVISWRSVKILCHCVINQTLPIKSWQRSLSVGFSSHKIIDLIWVDANKHTNLSMDIFENTLFFFLYLFMIHLKLWSHDTTFHPIFPIKKIVSCERKIWISYHENGKQKWIRFSSFQLNLTCENKRFLFLKW